MKEEENGMTGSKQLDVEHLIDFDELNKALFHFVDIMERCLCPFLLLDDTAKSVIDKERVEGDGIYAGVRISEFNESTYSMMRTLASNVDVRLGIENFYKTDKEFGWTYKDIPIKVKLIHRKYSFINNPTFAWYMAEEYKIPNPFNKYWKARFLVQ